jgi:ditrans,polycis-polyprenyl diphosphate synthase
MEWIAQFPLTQHVFTLARRQVCNALKSGPVPRHVGFIMDGNRTYAKQHNMELRDGHNAGFESMARILEVCYECGVECATVFAFSIENYKRPSHEVKWLMDLTKTKFKQIVSRGEICEKYGVRIRILGDLDLVPDDVKEVLRQAEEITKNNKRATLNVCFSYTSRADMTQAIRKVVDGCARGTLRVGDINDETISSKLWTGHSPPLELLIRTSGVHRMSDFMLWESTKDESDADDETSDAASDLAESLGSRSKSVCQIRMIDVLWPEFGVIDMIWLLIQWSFTKTYRK